MLSRTSRFGRGLLAVTAAVAIAACDAATDVAGPEAQPNEQDLMLADLVVVGGDNQEASVGATAPQPLVVRVVAEDGSPIPNAPVEWTFVQGRGQSPQWGSPREVVVVDTDAEGLSTVEWQLGTQAGVQTASAAIVVSDAVLSGTAPATAPPSDRGKKVGFEAKVKPGSVDDISLDPDAVTAEPGDSLALDAVVKDQYGNEIEGASLTWSSSDANVAEVDAEGVVRLLGVGTTQVSAKSGPVEGVATVTSVDDSPQPATVVVRPDDVTLQVGDTLRLDATILDAEGAELSGAEIAWNSSDGTVLSVDSEGLVTALGAGTAVVRATVDGVSGERTVVVEETVAEGPEAVGDLAVVAASDSSLTLRWTQVNDGTGSPADYAIRVGSPSISWGSAYETERTVFGNEVGALREFEWTGLESATPYEFQIVAYRGTLNETAVFGSVSAAVAGTTGGAPEPEELTVVANPEQIRLAAVGDTGTLSVHAENGVGEVVEDVTFEFSSSDPTIVEVNTMGRITARGLGVAVITVTTLCCGGSELVGVEVGSVDDIIVTRDGVPFTAEQIGLEVGQSTTFEVVAVDSMGAPLGEIEPEWASSNTSVATVSGGTMTAVGEGDAQITATYEGYAASLAVNVVDISDVAPFFATTFSNGVTEENAEFRWGSARGVVISSENAYVGTHSMRFRYHSDNGSSHDWSEQRFEIPNGIAGDEIWFEYRLYIPDGTESYGGAAYVHENYDTTISPASNNKFWKLYDVDGGSYNLHALLEGNRGSSPRITSARPMWGTNAGKGGLASSDYGDLGGEELINEADRGTWVHLRFHIKVSDPGQSNGIWRGWKNGSLIIEDTGIANDAVDGNVYAWRGGYLMGYDNSGFEHETFLFIDDIKFYHRDPQW